MIEWIKNYFKDMFHFKVDRDTLIAKKKRKERIRLTEEIKADILCMYDSNSNRKSDGHHLSYSDIGLLYNVSASSVGKVVRESKKDK